MKEPKSRGTLNLARAAAFLLPVVLLAPFAGKPFQADDHLSIWVAEQIARHPGDFFGFDVDYGYTRVPIHTISHNPPGTAYFLAALGALSGWNLFVLHAGMSLFAGLVALGTFELARDLGARPLVASLTASATPGFLVSASTLMTDVPMLACYVWAIVAWRRGCERNSWRWMFCAAACASAAALTKYFGITLVPLLLVDGVLRRPRLRAWWAWLAIPIAALGALQAYTYLRYGITPILDSVGVASAEHWRSSEQPGTRPLLTLVFLGGALLPLVVPAAWRRRVSWGAALAILAVGVSIPLLDGYSLIQLLIGTPEPFDVEVLIHVGVFTAAGLLVLSATVRALGDLPARDAVLLAAWVVGTLVFTIFVNHYINVRVLVPLLPAVAVVLALQRTGPAVPIASALLGIGLSVWLLIADSDVAEHDANAARAALERASADQAPLHYVAFWGLEYHLMKGGATPLAFAEQESFGERPSPLMEPGSLLLVDAYASGAWTPTPQGFTLVERIEEPYTAFATTFDTQAQAGFYWHGIGLLPYRLGRVAPETFLLLRWEGSEAE